jgi:hypothetical protein
VAVRVFLSIVVYTTSCSLTSVSKKVKISPTINAICLPIYREINQERSGCPTSWSPLVSPWSARENQRVADLGKLSAICVFMRFYAFLWDRPSPFSCLNSSNRVSPTIATISTDARKARVDCRRKILLNSWSYGTRLVATRLFDSMSSVVGDPTVAQAVSSLPRCDGSNWCLCCHKILHNSRSNVSNRSSRISGKNQAPWYLWCPIHKGALFFVCTN